MKIVTLALLAVAGVCHAASPAEDTFSKMKSLVGSWQAGGKTVAVYQMTGGGSALMETLFPGSEHEMVTLFHLDKDRLVMTHYCAAHNQPTMKLVPAKDPATIHFVFVSGTNMSPTDMHMHEMTIKVLGKDHIDERWQAYSDGKPGEMVKFDLHRASSH